MRVSHVVYGEDEASRVVVDGLANLVDEALLELEADLLARLGESDGAVAAGLRHLDLDFRGPPREFDQFLRNVKHVIPGVSIYFLLLTRAAADDVTSRYYSLKFHPTPNSLRVNRVDPSIYLINQEGR